MLSSRRRALTVWFIASTNEATNEMSDLTSYTASTSTMTRFSSSQELVGKTSKASTSVLILLSSS